MPTKDIFADSFGTLDFEGMANPNCQINALSKMCKLFRQKADRNPPVLNSLGNFFLTWRTTMRRCCCGTPLTVLHRKSKVNLTEPDLCDFDTGLHNAISSVWPSATIRGCYFHFKQALSDSLDLLDCSQKGGHGEEPKPKHTKWRMYDGRLLSIVDDFDEFDQWTSCTVLKRCCYELILKNSKHKW